MWDYHSCTECIKRSVLEPGKRIRQACAAKDFAERRQ